MDKHLFPPGIITASLFSLPPQSSSALQNLMKSAVFTSRQQEIRMW